MRSDQLASSIKAILAQGPKSAAELCAQLRVSQATLSRTLTKLGSELLKVGNARQRRYALARPIAGIADQTPVYEISSSGKAKKIAILRACHPRGFIWESLLPRYASRVFPDLPFALELCRPSGFLGRHVPRQHPELGAPADLARWSMDDHLRYITQYAWNAPGNLVVGDNSFSNYLEKTRLRADASADRKKLYAQLAEQSLSLGDPGSSAAGEQPKFLVGIGDRDYLVKFSPPLDEKIGQRWADLLTCEHLALETLRANNIQAAASRILESGKRRFLEVERFDRTPAGRRGLISIGILDAEFSGSNGEWSHISAALLKEKRLSEATHAQVCQIELFGKLIANSDMHGGNLSFYFENMTLGSLAPVYDMLPMFFAPKGSHMGDDAWAPALPKPIYGPHWKAPYNAALAFWEKVESDKTISAGFRKIAEANFRAVEKLRPRFEALPE